MKIDRVVSIALLTAAGVMFAVGGVAAAAVALENVQMNTDHDPPTPQNETAVALNVFNPMNAVAMSNDRPSDPERGVWIGATTDGGRHWSSLFRIPVASDGAPCRGGDPSVVYSRRDAAFYVSTLCHRDPGDLLSELHVWKSVDGGATWTDPGSSAIAVTNRAADGSIDDSFNFDKELLAVDNNPSSPYYGRLYMTFIEFNTHPSGKYDDFCPAQVAFTDAVPTANPRASTWTQVAIEPDSPGSKGIGPSNNQWVQPVVDETGALNVAYASEDCNSTRDRALFFRRSTNGGQTFGPRVQIDKPGQWRSDPNKVHTKLPGMHARTGLSPSLVFDPTRDRLLFAYGNAINNDYDVSLQVSDDFGATWSDARFLATTASGDPAPSNQFFPALAVDESGNIHAIWYDGRNDPSKHLIETFQGLSTDGGATWTNFNISTASWDPDEVFYGAGFPYFIGDYNGLAATTSVRYAVWTDGRNSPGKPKGNTDIFTNVEIGPP